METYKLPGPVPASIQTQLQMLERKIADASAVKRQALDDRKMVLETFYGLVGKVVEYTENQCRRTVTYRMLVTRVNADKNGNFWSFEGVVQPKGLRKGIYVEDINEGRVRVIGDAASA